MPIIPEALQKRRIQRPLTVGETAIVKQYGSLQAKTEYDKQVALQKEVSDFNSNISYENYAEQYKKLSPEARALVKSPDVVFASSEYKQYKEYQAAQEYQTAYNQVMKHYQKGMLWAVAAYGSGLKQQIARQLIKEGYSPALGGKLEQETQAKRNALLKNVREGNISGVTIKGSSLINTETGKPISISKVAEKYAAQQVTPTPTPQQLSVTTGTITAAPERTTVGALGQVASNLFYNVRQFASGRPQYIQQPFAPLSDIKERWFGGQEVKETYLLGDKELQLYPTTTPTFGGAGTSITSFGMSDIKVETPRTTAEQYILPRGSKIALTGFNKEIYLPDMASAEKLNQIIKYDDIKSYNKFVAEQQAKYKKDIGRYNLLQAQLSSQKEITQEEANEINALGQRIQLGYKGTLKDITRTAVQERGTTGAVWLYGGLRAGQTAYGIEKTYLGFQLGGAVAGTLLPAGVTAAIAGSKTVSTLGRLYVPSLIGGAGFRAAKGYVKGEYAPEYLGESAGILLGGLGSYYSKPIVEGGWRLTKATGRGIRYAAEKLGQTGYEQPKLVRGKRGSTQMYGGQVAESEYAYGGELYKKRLKQFKDYINRIKETKTFDKSGKEIIVQKFPSAQEKFDRLKVFLDKLNRGDPNKVRDFMKLVRETVGDDLARDFFIQEGLMLPKVRTTERPDALKFFDSSFQKPIKVTRTIIGTEIKTKPKAIVTTKSQVSIRESFIDVQGVRGIFGIASLIQPREKQKERFAYSPMSATLSVSKEVLKEEQVSTTRSMFGIAQVSPIVQEQPTIQEPVVGFPQPRPRRPEPREPIEPPKKPFGFEIPEFERKKKGFIDKPYDAFVRVDATKKQKARWVLVADNVPLVTALSKGGSFVDETPSNRFKVQPAKGKLNRIVDVAWNQLSNKFREYSQKGGVKVGLRPGNYIEKRKYRIDSPNERRSIPGAGRVAIARKFGRI